MLLDLSRIRTGTEHLERRYELPVPAAASEAFRLASPAELIADAHKDERKVRLKGRVRATLELDCSRCLEAFQVPVDATFDMLFLPAVETAGDGEREVAEDDFGVSYYRDETIDLGEVVREQCYLALPMKPLCRDDCQGLCPVCGINRNRETCGCHAREVDPRMEPLRKLKS